MTVESQIDTSCHTSHERNWGHRLQYERFRTALNKNRRDMSDNNFNNNNNNNIYSTANGLSPGGSVIT